MNHLKNHIHRKINYANKSILIDVFAKPTNKKLISLNQSLEIRLKNDLMFLQNYYNNNKIKFIKQVHEDVMIEVSLDLDKTYKSLNTFQWGEADAIFTENKDLPLVIRTADCIPIFLFGEKLPFIAGIHAGWKGLQKKIVTKSTQFLVEKYSVKLEDIQIWIGPHIDKESYEIEWDVASLFSDEFYSQSLLNLQKYYLHTLKILKSELDNLGVLNKNILEDTFNTFNSENYYSHRSKEKNRNMSVIQIIKRI